jgi:hypothetical protein
MADSQEETDAVSASISADGQRLAKRPKTGGRKKGSRNKRTVEKVRTAEREIAAARVDSVP